MSVMRQSRDFAGVGVAQWLADWAIMVGLSHLGLSLVAANMIGRAGGALFGFWLNGTITFSRDERRPRRHNLARYIVLWCVMAVLSTLGVSLMNRAFGRSSAWIAKPVIDGLLGVASFFASRSWVYR